jgi:hypothetical protein
VTIPASPGQYTIPPQDYLLFAASSNTVTFVGAGDLVVNDGSVDLNISDGIDLIKGIYPQYYVFVPTVTTATLTLANTEYSVTLPTDTRRYIMFVRGPGIVQYSFAVGTSGTNYVPLTPGAFISNGFIGAGSVTLYLQSPVAGTVVSFESWT